MKPFVRMLVVACVVLTSTSMSRAALVQRVISLDPQFFESFETTTDLTSVMDGLASVTGAGGATVVIQNGNYFNLWDQHAFDGSQFLGGAAGYGTSATVEISFQVPVNAFGGLFGHRVHPGINSSGETQFVFYDSRDREIGRDSVLIGSDPGSVPAYWRFNRDVKRITFTSIHPMADALVANLTPFQAKKLTRKLLKTSGTSGIAEVAASSTDAAM